MLPTALTPAYLKFLAPLTALLSVAAGAGALLYPPLRDQSALIPAVALVVLFAVAFVVALVHLGWRRLEAEALGAIGSDPAGTLADVTAAVSPVVTAAGHSPAEVLAAASSLLATAIGALPAPPAATAGPAPAAAAVAGPPAV